MICESAKTESFNAVKNMVYQLAWKYKCCNQCTFEDRLSTAFLAYSRAYSTFDHTRGTKFITHVHWTVRTALLNRRDDCCKRSKRYKQLSVKGDQFQAKNHHKFSDLLDDLSEDAKVVVGIIIEAPDDTIQFWLDSYDTVGMVRSYLTALGWSLSRITDIFSEVNQLLGGSHDRQTA